MLTRSKTFILALALGLAAGLPATAQDDAGASDDAAPGDQVQPEGDVPGGALPELDLGEQIDTEPATGQPYIREEFTDWALRCIQAPEGQPDPCELYQLLRDADGNEVAEFSVVPLPEGGEAVAGATVVAPLETLLTEQLVITVDGGEARRYPFRFCNRAGCVAQIGLTDAQVTQLKRGSAAQVRLVPAAAPDEEVVLDVSLSGFTAGYNATGE